MAPRVNVGITMPARHLLTAVGFPLARKTWRPFSEFNYSAGLDVIVSPRVTIASDVIGRIERNVFRFSYVKSDDDDLAPSFGPTGYGLRNQLLGSFGAKVNVHGRLLATASTLVPLNGSGLSARLGVVFGFDYAF